MKRTGVQSCVKRIRSELGLSQEALARLIGVSFQTVNRWESGAVTPQGLSSVVIQGLDKIIAGGKVKVLLEDLRSGALEGGPASSLHRILSLSFGLSKQRKMAQIGA